MPLEVREVCKMCNREIIPEKMGVIACRNCLPKTGQVNFKSQEEKNFYYKEKARQARIKKLPFDRVCPRCTYLFPNTRSWVIRVDRLVVCRRCNYEINLRKGIRMEAALDKAFTAVHTTRYLINGAALREARKKLRVSMGGVAKLCGWHLSYINELECGDTLEISDESFQKLMKAFETLREIPDYDEEIAALKEKQRASREQYGRSRALKRE